MKACDGKIRAHGRIRVEILCREQYRWKKYLFCLVSINISILFVCDGFVPKSTFFPTRARLVNARNAPTFYRGNEGFLPKDKKVLIEKEPLLSSERDDGWNFTRRVLDTTNEKDDKYHDGSVAAKELEFAVFADPISTEGVSSRRFFMASTLIAIATSIQPNGVDAGDAKEKTDRRSALQWETSPINKRYGVSLYDAEKTGYNVRFITYLSRFLISFDEDCQRWWYARGADIPRAAKASEVGAFRSKQFGAFSASVEVGLQEFSGPEGPKELMNSLLQRYCPSSDSLAETRKANNLPPLSQSQSAKQQREIKEARRQIALLFGLMENNQPVDEITMLLAAIDNATVTSVSIIDPGSGYAPGYGSPLVTFPAPEAGYPYEPAQGRAILRSAGRVLRIDITDRGEGYSKPPIVTISPPASLASDPTASQATAKAFIFRQGANKGKIERIQLVDSGTGYDRDEAITVEITPPEEIAKNGGRTAVAKAVPELEIGEIRIVRGGSGYAAERPIQVYIEPPPLTARLNMNDPLAVGLAAINQTIFQSAISSPQSRTNVTGIGDLSTKSTLEYSFAIYRGRGDSGGCIGKSCYGRAGVAIAYPTAEKDSFVSLREDSDILNSSTPSRKISGSTSGIEDGIPSIPSWGGGPSSSSQLLPLLPSGIGLEFDESLKRYIIAVDVDFTYSGSGTVQGRTFKPLDPEFGPRGRSPIERDKQLDFSTFARFSASGAICCSGVHLILTPIDVVKTKVQTNPEKYPGLFSALKTVASEEGVSSFFTGWAPTFLGFFVNGASSYSITEFIRRYFTDLAGNGASSLEVPIILAAASISAFFGSFTLAPFEAVRVRSVAQPDYANNIVGVLNRMVDEEGALSLFSAVPAFLPKEILFACAKFTVFDLSTQWLYETYPVAREDLRLSLLISLAGGTLGGIAAAIVSNPADATISEMKKAKTDMGPVEAVRALIDKGGIPFLFRGLGIRMVFYTLIVSLQFLVYDAVRYSLGIGSDDLKIYLDVLGGALGETGGPV